MPTPSDIPRRLVIYPKDIKIIIGKSYLVSWRLWRQIHKALKKKEHQVISIQEFCDYMGLEESLVTRFIK